MHNNRIKVLRERKGLTLLDLSKRSGISVGYLCHLELGSRNNPSLEAMEKISKALNEPLAEVFFIQE